MGKGKRAHLDFKPPLSSADILHKDSSLIDTQHAIFQPNQTNHEFDENLETTPLIHLITTYLSYLILIVTGHIRDFIRKRINPKAFENFAVKDGYAPLTTGFGIISSLDTFYHRNLYTRIRDAFNRPVTDVPGRTINVLERVSKDNNETFEYQILI